MVPFLFLSARTAILPRLTSHFDGPPSQALITGCEAITSGMVDAAWKATAEASSVTTAAKDGFMAAKFNTLFNMLTLLLNIHVHVYVYF